MGTNYRPGIVGSLLRIHKIITRGLDVIIQRGQYFIRWGFPDDQMRSGYIDYVRSCMSILDAHHLTEDEVVFPYFRELMTDARFDLLVAQHQKMIPFLQAIQPAIEKPCTNKEARTALKTIISATSKIFHIWNPHIAREERYFTQPRVAALIDEEEQINLNNNASEFSQQHSGPDYLVIPFILYNLPKVDRDDLIRELPPFITQQLVPVDWKEKWAPMLPFLIDVEGQ